jgi:hypothetical protein
MLHWRLGPAAAGPFNAHAFVRMHQYITKASCSKKGIQLETLLKAFAAKS